MDKGVSTFRERERMSEEAGVQQMEIRRVTPLAARCLPYTIYLAPCLNAVVLALVPSFVFTPRRIETRAVGGGAAALTRSG